MLLVAFRVSVREELPVIWLNGTTDEIVMSPASAPTTLVWIVTVVASDITEIKSFTLIREGELVGVQTPPEKLPPVVAPVEMVTFSAACVSGANPLISCSARIRVKDFAHVSPCGAIKRLAVIGHS